jgi:DNA-binding transcriptional ArsR family regulator
MLRSLAAGERNIGELAAPFRMSFAAASKHVKVLESAGLVHRQVQGRSHICRIKAAPLAAADEWLRFYERFWNQQLDALEAVLAAEDRAASSPSTKKKGRGR